MDIYDHYHKWHEASMTSSFDILKINVTHPQPKFNGLEVQEMWKINYWNDLIPHLAHNKACLMCNKLISLL